jgi:hypothetical protein
MKHDEFNFALWDFLFKMSLILGDFIEGIDFNWVIEI